MTFRKFKTQLVQKLRPSSSPSSTKDANLNAMSPLQISIPTDVLCVIFDMLRMPGDRQYDSSSLKLDWSLHWVPEVTHVCHSWRETALSVRFLWTDIHIDASVPWAVEFARRSGNAPIRIFIYDTSRLCPEAFECMKSLLHENRQRIQGICLEDIYEEDLDEITYALLDDAELEDHGPAFFPILDNLKMSLYKTNDYRDNDYYIYSFLLPNKLLRAPKLKILSLEYCVFPKNLGTFQSLSHLSITETSRSEPSDFAAPFLCRALLDMPNLESLKLTLVREDFGPRRVIPAIFETQLATLPRLHHIQIGEWPIKWIIPFLKMISSGPQRTVWVSSFDPHRLEQIHQLFTCIMSHAIESSSIRRLMLHFIEEDVCVRASHRNQDLRDLDDIRFSVSFPRSDISRSRRNGFDPTPSLLNGLLQRMNLQDLQNLELSFSTPLSTQLWVKFFGKLPSLASIGISSGEPQLFAALIDGSDETNLTMALPFQALSEVRVNDGGRRVYADEDMECMLKCLRKLMDLGMTLKKLSFIMGGSESRLFDLLSQVDVFRGVVTEMEVSTNFY